MLYEEWPAPLALQPYVAAFWLVRGRPAARYEKILPGTFAHLVLNLSEPYRLIETHPRDPASGSTSGSRATEVAVGFYSGLQRSFLISENPARIFNIGAVLAPFGLAARRAGGPDAGPGFHRARHFLAARLDPGFSTDQRSVSAAAALAAEDLRWQVSWWAGSGTPSCPLLSAPPATGSGRWPGRVGDRPCGHQLAL